MIPVGKSTESVNDEKNGAIGLLDIVLLCVGKKSSIMHSLVLKELYHAYLFFSLSLQVCILCRG